MRNCRPFAEPSSIDEIQLTCNAFDEGGDLDDLISHISALARSESNENVTKALQNIEQIVASDLTPEQMSTVMSLNVLVLFRLKKDKECKRYCSQMLKQGIHTQYVQQILDIIKNEEKSENISNGLVAAGATAAVFGGIALLAGLIFRRNNKK